jgi:hypothetical protein
MCGALFGIRLSHEYDSEHFELILRNLTCAASKRWLEAAQVKILRHLLGITKLDKRINVLRKKGAQNIVKEI